MLAILPLFLLYPFRKNEYRRIQWQKYKLQHIDSKYFRYTYFTE